VKLPTKARLNSAIFFASGSAVIALALLVSSWFALGFPVILLANWFHSKTLVCPNCGTNVFEQHGALKTSSPWFGSNCRTCGADLSDDKWYPPVDR
jgi:hypothetical protein